MNKHFGQERDYVGSLLCCFLMLIFEMLMLLLPHSSLSPVNNRTQALVGARAGQVLCRAREKPWKKTTKEILQKFLQRDNWTVNWKKGPPEARR